MGNRRNDNAASHPRLDHADRRPNRLRENYVDTPECRWSFVKGETVRRERTRQSYDSRLTFQGSWERLFQHPTSRQRGSRELLH